MLFSPLMKTRKASVSPPARLSADARELCPRKKRESKTSDAGPRAPGPHGALLPGRLRSGSTWESRPDCRRGPSTPPTRHVLCRIGAAPPGQSRARCPSPGSPALHSGATLGPRARDVARIHSPASLCSTASHGDAQLTGGWGGFVVPATGAVQNPAPGDPVQDRPAPPCLLRSGRAGLLTGHPRPAQAAPTPRPPRPTSTLRARRGPRLTTHRTAVRHEAPSPAS